MANPVELAVGENAPNFEATVTDGNTIGLSEMLSSGDGVILYFYPRDNTSMNLDGKSSVSLPILRKVIRSSPTRTTCLSS